MTKYTHQPDYSRRRMFLDSAGSVSIQRYDDFAYPKQDKFTKTQRGAIWIPDEITLTKDKIDFGRADDATRFIFTSNILRQTALDSIQGRMPVTVFTPVSSVPETEAWALWWSAFEQIHSESYSHIVRNIYSMPHEQFNAIHDTSEIVDMMSSVDRHYTDLHVINSKVAVLEELRRRGPVDPAVEAALSVSESEHVRAVWMALNASYALEAIRFMVSFSTSLGMTENKIFMGNGNIISLILADELLHTDATAWLLNVNVKDDERFRAAREECREEVYDMYMSVIAEEKRWADYIFQKGTVLGLNASIMKSFVDWTASHRLRDIGIKYDSGHKSSPLPWFNKHLNTNKKQTALQEAESVSYIVGAMTSEIHYDDLPEI
jgi:ribonucleoside-diphosphate reductase beta chain